MDSLLVCVVSVVTMLLSSFVIGLTGDEKKFVIMKMKELGKGILIIKYDRDYR